jgi:hypothetical protein
MDRTPGAVGGDGGGAAPELTRPEGGEGFTPARNVPMGMESRPSTEVNVALQGTIETFALPDVMRLLASSKKTGCLHLRGSRGLGSIWVSGGQIVGGEVSSAPFAEGAPEVLFELLRFGDGDFVFEGDEVPPDPSVAVDVEPLLTEAEQMLVEWAAIEAVVPSADVWVTLVADLPEDELTISRERWRIVAAVGSGCSVGQLEAQLEMGELDAARQVKELVEAGLVGVGEPPAGADAVASGIAPQFDDQLVESDNGHGEPFEPFDPDSLVVDRDQVEITEPMAEPEPEPHPQPEPVPVAAGYGGGPGDAAEIARQLANLSPKAAKAVAAAAKATTEAERQAALAEVDETEDPINRELLIKFLGSVNS